MAASEICVLQPWNLLILSKCARYATRNEAYITRISSCDGRIVTQFSWMCDGRIVTQCSWMRMMSILRGRTEIHFNASLLFWHCNKSVNRSPYGLGKPVSDLLLSTYSPIRPSTVCAITLSNKSVGCSITLYSGRVRVLAWTKVVFISMQARTALGSRNANRWSAGARSFVHGLSCPFYFVPLRDVTKNICIFAVCNAA